MRPFYAEVSLSVDPGATANAERYKLWLYRESQVHQTAPAGTQNEAILKTLNIFFVKAEEG
jgi:hypothetical protein